ncbi:tetratricopeptide repeat protein [Flavobacterium sp. NRK F10]|nr:MULTISPECIES: tetratricopeptide repeat protein [Flavobacterium]MCO6173917.1 tetratricopeptide repeat protein [Flavobacterium sp. NRK F10]
MKFKILSFFLYFFLIYPVKAQFHQDFQKGIDYLKTSKIDSALYFFKKIEKQVTSSDDSIKGIYKLNLGKVLKLKQDYPEALKLYEEAESIFNTIKLYDRLAETYLNIGEFYRAKYDFDLSLEYLNEAKEIIDKHHVSRETEAYYWSRRAALYIEKEYDCHNSIKCSQKVLELFKGEGANALVASAFNEIGYAYKNLNKDVLAEEYYKEALQQFRKINDELYEANVLINIIRLYEKKGRIQKAKSFIDRGLEISRKKQYNIYLQDFKFLEAGYFKVTGNYKKALDSYEVFRELEKAEFISKWNKQIIEAERKYELEKKNSELEIKELNLKNQANELKSSRVNFFIAVGILFSLIILTLIVLFFFRKTQKNNKVLEKLSKENEFLLSETNHRINNNLQLITILISDELRKANAESENIPIKKILAKVETIAILHRHLYQSADKRQVDIHEYLNEIKSVYGEVFEERNITIDLKIDSVLLSSDTTMFIGLLVTELIINSIKHAYTREQEKAILISVLREKDFIHFLYHDNGEKPKTKEIDPKLVAQLCLQLDVEYKIDVTKGFKITFSKKIA